MTEGKYPERTFLFISPQYVVFQSWFKQSNTGSKSTDYWASHHGPYKLQSCRSEDRTQSPRNTSSYNILIGLFHHSHRPCTCCTFTCSPLGNRCHGIFPIKQNDTFIKPQAWLFTRIRSQTRWHLIRLVKEVHTELANHILSYSNKEIVGKQYRFLFTVDLVAF